MPVNEFVGVAVSTSITEEGVLSSAIELVHGDPELNYRVFEEIGNANVVAEWQNWGKKLRLPLFIKAGDGRLLPYSQQVDGVALGVKHDRRHLAADASVARFSIAGSPASRRPAATFRGHPPLILKSDSDPMHV